MPKKLKLKYFAKFREETNKSSEEIEVDSNISNLEDLYIHLNSQYNFSLPLNRVKFSLNTNYTDNQTEIASGDEIVFIPPVAGG